MLYFNCDYNEGAHPRILEILTRTNLEQTPGYGEDEYCRQAAELICKNCGRDDLDVHFMSGGTQTNLTVISAALRAYQGVVSAETGHINVHETGSIEAVGHKVLALPSPDGKVAAEQVRKLCQLHYADGSREHTVQPKMVYISNPTEVGTIYSRKELAELRAVCDLYGLYLYMDGARLGYGLCAKNNDLDLTAIAELCDLFYIGGTKQGALLGEALVIRNSGLKQDFRYMVKQKGGMLAKGRLLGIQFLALFQDQLYFELSRHADELAGQICRACEENGFPLLFAPETNQLFPVLPDGLLRQLESDYCFNFWEKTDKEHTAVRICTSWATPQESVERLIHDLSK